MNLAFKKCWSSLAACSAAAAIHIGAVASTPSPTERGWQADLDRFARELPLRHANAFHRLERAQFDDEVAQLAASLPALNADQFWVGLARIESSIGDGHTFMRLPPNAPIFGFDFRRFGQDYRVVSIASGSVPTRALGARLIAINGIEIEDVRKRVLELTPQDELLPLREFRAQKLLSNGLVLHGLGIAQDSRQISYRFVDEQGHHFRMDATALDQSSPTVWKSVVAKPPVSQQSSDRSLSCSSIYPAKTVYCNFKSYVDIEASARAAFEFINRSGATRLILDMRENDGGNFCKGLEHLVRPIAANPVLNRDGHLFVLVGQRTFSAAMSNAAHFRQLTHAILVGQPIGEKPDSYQEIEDLELPNTGWTARYSTRLYHFSNGGPNVIEPDVTVATTWEAYKQGLDEVLMVASELSRSNEVHPLVQPNVDARAAESDLCGRL